MSNSRPLALVTGASSGIGADLARELARDGHDLVLAARRVAAMQTLADELKGLGASATVIAADLSKPGAAAALVGELASRKLVIDVLVNNSGLGDHAEFVAEDMTRISEMLQVNMVALTELTRLLAPGMVQRRRGRILLVASTAAFQPGPHMAVYCASKSYVLSLGEAIGHELRGSGVDVTVLCPGATLTEFSKVASTEGMALHRSPIASRMSSAEVARQGYAALKRGRRVIVTGAMNSVAALLVRFLPRATVISMAATALSKA